MRGRSLETRKVLFNEASLILFGTYLIRLADSAKAPVARSRSSKCPWLCSWRTAQLQVLSRVDRERSWRAVVHGFISFDLRASGEIRHRGKRRPWRASSRSRARNPIKGLVRPTAASFENSSALL
jgi:hypothetical protein